MKGKDGVGGVGEGIRIEMLRVKGCANNGIMNEHGSVWTTVSVVLGKIDNFAEWQRPCSCLVERHVYSLDASRFIVRRANHKAEQLCFSCCRQTLNTFVGQSQLEECLMVRPLSLQPGCQVLMFSVFRPPARLNNRGKEMSSSHALPFNFALLINKRHMFIIVRHYCSAVASASRFRSFWLLHI